MDELRGDLEDCEEIEEDRYGARSTTVARARLCGACIHYTIENRLMTSIRCTLGLRPTVEMNTETRDFKAQCEKFEKKSKSATSQN